jgi:hypothetical protein
MFNIVLPSEACPEYRNVGKSLQEGGRVRMKHGARVNNGSVCKQNTCEPYRNSTQIANFCSCDKMARLKELNQH